MKLREALDNYHKILLFIPETSYAIRLGMDVIKELGEKRRVIYVTLDKSTHSLSDMMKSAKISTDNLFFVDAFSSYMKPSIAPDNTFFVSAPYRLGEISENVIKLLDQKSIVLFDSLSSLLNFGHAIKARENRVGRFVDKILPKLKETESSMLFLAKKEDQECELIKESLSVYDVINHL